MGIRPSDISHVCHGGWVSVCRELFNSTDFMAVVALEPQFDVMVHE